MSPRTRKVLIALLLLLALALLLFIGRCRSNRLPAPMPTATTSAPANVVQGAAVTAFPVVAAPGGEERLTAATLTFPSEVDAGAPLTLTWSGPGNAGDYVTIVRPASGPGEYGSYRETREGAQLELTAPIETGDWEVRYVAVRSRTVLARGALVVRRVEAHVTAPAEVIAGAVFPVQWRGPNHAGDYVTISSQGAKDGAMFRMTYTTAGSSAKVDAPADRGAADVRYMSGQGNRVLARAELELD